MQPTRGLCSSSLERRRPLVPHSYHSRSEDSSSIKSGLSRRATPHSHRQAVCCGKRSIAREARITEPKELVHRHTT